MAVDHAVLQLPAGRAVRDRAEWQPRTGQITASDADGERLQVEARQLPLPLPLFARGNRGDVADSSSQSKPHRGP
jgi:hypothetical protein